MTFEEIVTRYRMACFACPTQYEGQLTDGRSFCFRYRYGHASLGLGATVADAIDDSRRCGACLQLGGDLHGYMTEDEFKSTLLQLWALHPAGGRHRVPADLAAITDIADQITDAEIEAGLRRLLDGECT